MKTNPETLVITGAHGYLGRQLVAGLAARIAAGELAAVIATDVREVPQQQRQPRVLYLIADIRQPGLDLILRQHAVDTVVHLASIVTPGKKSERAFEYRVDVEGTKNVLEACITAGVGHIIISSSCASYGYHADNPAWLSESDAIRGNYEFAYSWHKRLVEEMLARYQQSHPELKQTIFRISTILGDTVRNQITDLFEKPRLIAIRGSDSPFVFIWDQDVVGTFLFAIESGKIGIFNLTGDGALTIYQLAAKLGKPVVALPASVIEAALWILKKLRLTQYGPEQVKFLLYRPVLDNRRLKDEFGYVPAKTSAAGFDYWLQSRKPDQR